MAYVVTAYWTAREGEEKRVLEAVRKMIGPSRAEPGCLHYQPSVDPENPRVIFIYEEYVDAAAYEAHGESKHFRKHGLAEGIPLLDSRTRTFYETLDSEER